MTGFDRPRGLNHVAYVTRDTAATKRFYTELLGLRLVGYAMDDSVGSTGEPTTFLHTFFEMGDGSCIAFFEIEGLDADHNDSPLPRWAPHIALSLDSLEEVGAARDRLVEAGVEVKGVVDHEGIWSSIYFFDPNGVRLELTYQNRPLNDDDAAAAEKAVRAWQDEHGPARA
ncbi:VOC family protein [Actinomadura chibensis]|uniref:VOC family protein n=1 Tax=Actinomadura chibensis TaxID=392828 RepID=A0A5D0NW74_9ACTN|nr:VOC family protein [Actinomadura chibensis]TYB48933.1 VOC family protein [Actinomadura chibensis]